MVSILQSFDVHFVVTYSVFDIAGILFLTFISLVEFFIESLYGTLIVCVRVTHVFIFLAYLLKFSSFNFFM